MAQPLLNDECIIHPEEEEELQAKLKDEEDLRDRGGPDGFEHLDRI